MRPFPVDGLWRDEWLQVIDAQNVPVSAWCEKRSGGETQAVCKCCSRSITFTSHGVNALTMHAATAIHIAKFRAYLLSINSILLIFVPIHVHANRLALEVKLDRIRKLRAELDSTVLETESSLVNIAKREKEISLFVNFLFVWLLF